VTSSYRLELSERATREPMEIIKRYTGRRMGGRAVTDISSR
jgi:hypothetical protein